MSTVVFVTVWTLIVVDPRPHYVSFLILVHFRNPTIQ
nr:MAG TPA_asm: hypothetical protein [Caudoviricetes sp.]DAX12457.1 MAG TPA: hypothetical protein [Caudoviricetes sp.]